MAKKKPAEDAPDDVSKPGDNVSEGSRRLASYVNRLEKLDEEKRNIGEDIKVVKQEAKAAGFNTKVLADVLKRRRMDRADREEYDALLAVYETNIDSVLSEDE